MSAIRITQMKDTDIKVFLHPAFAEVHFQFCDHRGIRYEVVLDSESAATVIAAMEHMNPKPSIWTKIKRMLRR